MIDTFLYILTWMGLGIGLFLGSALWGFINLVILLQTVEFLKDFFKDDEEEISNYGEYE